jgi:hypothetical protein
VSSRKTADDLGATSRMAEHGVNKAAMCSVIQACHTGLRQILWTYDREGEIGSQRGSQSSCNPR